MANEMIVPLLPCASIDDIVTFYGVLGFSTTYVQRRPNPCAGLRREDLHLQFFELPGFDPGQSYGSCLVLTSDIAALHRAFAAGMRAAYGKVLVSGIPRMTRPRARRNAEGVGGFSIVDPGGNWIRVFQDTRPESARPAAASAPAGRLATTLANAVVLADSKGDAGQAARILDSALARPRAGDDPVTLAEVVVYRAELALTLGDRGTATAMLARLGTIALDADETARAAPTFEIAADLAAALR
ncbi:VOC family protein [Actinoplanes sp. RD1]|uniref:VOC family protein n=1 Tax=Actinoplanes sp. RD1 TaxID=3064538 RepID=UPI0027425B0B|nr:VOC family protein [Actinoplanes sp. RD1]